MARVGNIVGKGENAVYQHFLLFPQCFQKASVLESLKNGDCVVKSLHVGPFADSVDQDQTVQIGAV